MILLTITLEIFNKSFFAKSRYLKCFIVDACRRGSAGVTERRLKFDKILFQDLKENDWTKYEEVSFSA